MPIVSEKQQGIDQPKTGQIYIFHNQATNAMNATCDILKYFLVHQFEVNLSNSFREIKTNSCVALCWSPMKAPLEIYNRVTTDHYHNNVIF